MDGGVVELDALADADGTGTQHDNHGTTGTLQAPGFAGLVRAGIEVWRFRSKFRAAGIHHLIAHGPAGNFCRTGNPPDGSVRITHLLEGFIVAGLQSFAFRAHLQLRHGVEAIEKEPVDLGDVKDLVYGHALLQGFEDREEPAVVLPGQALTDRFIRQRRRVQCVQGDLSAADGLHQGFLKALADGHDLAGGLHLGTQAAGRTVEFVEGPLRELYDHIVDGGLEAGAGFTGDIVGNLIQGIAQGEACGDLGDGITGGLAG